MPSSPSRPLITAHRGASHEAPENTLAALRLGFGQGADAGECDVRLTRDGRVVLCHDATTRRTGRAALVVADSAFEELRGLDVGAWKGRRWEGEKIPALEEALALVPARRRLLVEIKCGTEILPAIGRAFAQSARPAAEFVLLMSFDLEVAVAAKRLFPAVETHWVVERGAISAEELAGRARAAGLDGLNLDRRFPIDEAFVSAVHGAGLRLHVWTVDDAALAARLAAAGVDSLTTDRPGWLRETLSAFR